MATKVLFLCPYPEKHAPSQRFRVELYKQYLHKAGIEYKIAPFIDERTWDILYKGGSTVQKALGIAKGFLRRIKTTLVDVHRYDYVFVHREASPVGPPVFEWLIARLWRKKMIYDFDDAIWIENTSAENKIASFLKSSWKIKSICKWSYKIAAGNDYLASFARQYNSNVYIIPTAVDVEHAHNRLKQHSTNKLVVGWTGSHSTLFYLEEVIPILQELQNEFDFTFMVIANKDPKLPLQKYRFVQWSEQTEIDDLMKMDIGIMPLTPDKWSEGKCGFKLIQYLSLGIPAIASPVGVNTKIISHGAEGYIVSSTAEWKSALTQLIKDVHLRLHMGKKGREKIVNEYSIQSQKEKFIDLFS